MRQKLLSSKLFAAVVQHQILFGSNLQRFGLPAAKLAPGRWASEHGCWESSLGLRLRGSRVLLAGGGGALQRIPPYQLFTLPRLGRACCSFLVSSSSSWKLSTRSSAVRPVAASVSCCHFGSASAGSSCSCRHPSLIASPVRLTMV